MIKREGDNNTEKKGGRKKRKKTDKNRNEKIEREIGKKERAIEK
jgi:hypothetical protein